MELVPAEQQTYIHHLFSTSARDIEHGVVETTRLERIRLFRAWKGWLKKAFPTLQPNLHGLSKIQQISILAAYGRHVRYGGLSPKKHKVCAQTVALSFRAISTSLQLDGQPNPLVEAEGKYPKAIRMLLETYKREDPPSKPQLAVPVAVPEMMYMLGVNGKTEQKKCVGDFGLIAFYYLLRVGEYTYVKDTERRRTQQFRLQDVKLWRGTTLLDPRFSKNYLCRVCTPATLNISNQKNGVRQQTIHQEALGTATCPVSAIIRRVKHIRQHTANPETMLGSYFELGKPIKSITSTHITKAVKKAVTTLQLDKRGLPAKRVASHSLRSGGAMALHCAGVSDTTIKKMGRWSSDTFLMYIHEQISAFSRGLSQKMAKHIQFHNIAFTPMRTKPTVTNPAA